MSMVKPTYLVIAAVAIVLGVYFLSIPPSVNNGGLIPTPTPTPTPTTEVTKQEVKLFYYNAPADKKTNNENSEVLCSADAVLPVIRIIPATKSPIKDTLELLFQGGITPAEKAAGFQTEFPLQGVMLISASLKNDGTLTLDLADPDHKTSGGACRSSILAAQVIKTAKQFSAVKRVEFLNPDSVFQP